MIHHQINIHKPAQFNKMFPAHKPFEPPKQYYHTSKTNLVKCLSVFS